MATRLSEGLQRAGYQLRFPTEANGVFVVLPPVVDAALRDRGHAYYPFGDPAWKLFRLMCSFDTQPAQVEAFLAHAGSAAGR
jgi:threonine aldolase